MSANRNRSTGCLGRILTTLVILAIAGAAGYYLFNKFQHEVTDYADYPVTEEAAGLTEPEPSAEEFQPLESYSEEGFVDYFKFPVDENDMYVSETHRDYSRLAGQITSGCESDFQKIRAIYQWICENIAYDTTYTINTADACISSKKGVCQAYCELFHRLAQAVGVRTEIIMGITKDHMGVISTDGHAWIFAYTRENRGILLDPTWGAGSVNDGKFSRRENCWIWFNVPPEGMILRHFPENESYQLLNRPISRKEFDSMSSVDQVCFQYGLDVHTVYEMARGHEPLPRFYEGGESEMEILEAPLGRTLKVGETYSFRIRKRGGRKLSLINDSLFVEEDKWQDLGDGVYAIDYMVRDVNDLKLCLMDESIVNQWHCYVMYEIAPPDESDWRKVEESYPLSVPDVKNVGNLNADDWVAAGVDGHWLLDQIRENHIETLPMLYLHDGQALTIVSVPMDKVLSSKQTYTFSFRPQSGSEWAIINGTNWHRDWQTAEDGTLSMTLKPEKGKLKLSVRLGDDNKFWSCLEYEVR